MRKTRLEPKKTGYSEGYNKTLDPSVANNFATAAFRFGHTLIPALIKFLKTEAAQPEYVQLHKMLFNPFVLYKPHGLDGSLRGALNTSIEAADTYFNAQVRPQFKFHFGCSKIKFFRMLLAKKPSLRGKRQ